MSRIRRAAHRALLTAVAAVALVGLTPTAAAGRAGEEYVKYYTVTSGYQGKPENLTEIAARFLGDGSRSGELFTLNSGRRQPDGKVLTDPARLNAGWMLVLPWDAHGAGIQYDVLPEKTPAPAKSAPPKSGAAIDDSTKGSAGSPVKSGSKPAVEPSSPPKAGQPAERGECATAAASTTRSDWANLRLAADQAWPHSRGKGQLVAVVDSGVDGTLPQLTGHVAVGMDMVGGTGRGDTDCLGTGTAMAGLIVARSTNDSSVAGIAPDATVMPVRVVGKDPKARPDDGAAAIEVAAAAGATVIAIGSYLDLTKPETAEAINAAVAKGVVVVTGAMSGSVSAKPAAKIDDGVLRVGGIGMDGQPADDYVQGGVDVAAPGVNVSSIGITGTGSVSGSGTHYAAAFVAGQVALVRAAYPELNPEQVVHRIKRTAENLGGGAVPHGQYGYGLIDPAASVTEVLPEEARAVNGNRNEPAAGPAATGSQVTLLVIAGLVALSAAVLLVFRIRGLLRGEDLDAPSTRPQPSEPTTHRSDDPPVDQPDGLPTGRPDDPPAPPAPLGAAAASAPQMVALPTRPRHGPFRPARSARQSGAKDAEARGGEARGAEAKVAGHLDTASAVTAGDRAAAGAKSPGAGAGHADD